MWDDSETHSMRIERLLRELARTPISSGLRAGVVVAGRYELVDVVGRGGMGRVWRCHDLIDGGDKALKELTSSHTGVDVLFKRELYTMTRLAHPNTVRVFDCGALPSGQRYLVMELVPGEDARVRLRSGPLPLELACRVLVDLAHVLAFIHSRMYVHCDIKAANVRLTEHGAIKLLDFGLMHQLGAPSGASVGGTPNYMSPEAITGGIIDARTDLYSLGVLGFELLTGHPPFHAATLAELFEMHESAPVPELHDVPPRLRAIIEKLMAKRPRDRFQRAGDVLLALDGIAGVSVEVASVAQRTSYLTSADLVGRERELAILRARLDAVRGGGARSLFVSAASGVGKSRLLQETRLQAKLLDLACGVGHCRAEGREPLRPMLEAIAPLVELAPDDVLASAGPVLADVLPSLQRRGHVPRQASKSELFAAITETMVATARTIPFLLCLEDMHWADAATIELANTLIRALRGEPAFVVATFRPAEVDPFSALVHTVLDGIADRLEIAELAADDAHALLESMLDADVPREFLAQIQTTTGGNPFFITETLRALVEQRHLELRGGRWHAAELDVPPSLYDVVAGRLRALDADTLALCRAVAPLGRVFSLELAKALGGMPDEALFAQLQELTERQFIQYVDGRYAFVHDALQEAIYRDTPDGTKRHAHRRIAELLDEDAAIGWHYARSDEPERAVPFLFAAGESLLARNLLLDATRQFQTAADVLEREEIGDQLLFAWSRLCDAAAYGDPPVAVRAGEKLFAAWQQRIDLAAAARRVASDRQHWRALATPEAHVNLVRSYDDQPLRPDSRDAETILPFLHVYRGRIASSYGSLGQLDRSFAIAETSLALAPDPDDPFRAAALLSRGVALLQRGEWTREQAEAREAIDIFERHMANVGVMPQRLHWFHAEAYYFRLMGQAMMGHQLDDTALARGLDVARRGGFEDVYFCLRLAELERAALTGDPAAGETLLVELANMIQQLGRPRLLESRLYLFAPMYFLQRREVARQTAPIDKLESFLAMMDDAFIRLYVKLYRALAATGADPATAERITDDAIAAAREHHYSRLNLLSCTRAEQHLARGQRDAALRVAGEALERARSNELANPFDETIALRVLGEATGGVDGAARLRESLALAETHANQLHAGRALLALDHLDKARAVFERLRADAWIAEVERHALK